MLQDSLTVDTDIRTTNFKSKALLWITAKKICLLNLIPLFSQALELTELPMTNNCLISQTESLRSQSGREERKKENKYKRDTNLLKLSA